MGVQESARGLLSSAPHHDAPSAFTPSSRPRWGPCWLASFVDTVSAPAEARALGGGGASTRGGKGITHLLGKAGHLKPSSIPCAWRGWVVIWGRGHLTLEIGHGQVERKTD